MTRPKITVIIPTRERPDTLEMSLRTVTAQNYDNLEIIVSDNFSCDNTEAVVRRNQDPRIKYINTRKRVSMSHNYEFALSHVQEGWVAIIGDDDGLLPDCLEHVGEIIRNTGTRAIRTSCCNYRWPSTSGKSFGRLGVPLTSGIEVRNSKIWLNKLMNGKAWYTDLPCLYHGGFIDISAVRDIKKKTGSFYKSSQPDVYSGVAISNVVDSFVYSHEPFAINGNSHHSTGASFMSASPATNNWIDFGTVPSANGGMSSCNGIFSSVQNFSDGVELVAGDALMKDAPVLWCEWPFIANGS